MNLRALWRRLRDERGQATLEAILVVPLVLVPVLFGVVTFGELVESLEIRGRSDVAQCVEQVGSDPICGDS